VGPSSRERLTERRAGDVHVWRIPLDDVRVDASALSADERDRASRFRFATDRRRWSACRFALREILGDTLGCRPAAVPLLGARDVRAHLGGSAPWLSFNLARSGAFAVIALASGLAVGVDVEQFPELDRRELALVAARVLPGDARDRIAAADDHDAVAVFTHEWVRHEALVKCRGDGLVDRDRGPLPRTDPEQVLDLEVAPGYAGAIATEDAPTDIRYRERP
jgi:4'-phosphopantetheinyl transferase